MRTHTRRTSAAALGLLACAIARDVRAAALANSISVSGDSISRGYDANTGSCNYGDNVSRSWATGDDHGTSFCSAGPTGTYSHAERLECAAGGNITNFNDARTGATMLGDFASQAEQTFSPARIAQIKSAKVQSAGDVRSVFTEDISGSEATVFGVVDETVSNVSSPTPRADVLRVELGLIQTTDGWKVNSVNILQSPGATTAPSG